MNNENLNLKIFTSNSSDQIKILLHLLLTFRLDFKTLANLFGLKESDLLDSFLKLKGLNYLPLIELIYYEDIDEVKSKNKLLNYYQALITTKDKQEKLILNSLITDIVPIMISKKMVNLSNDIDLVAIFIYQIKYSLSFSDIAKLFKIKEDDYILALNNFFNSETKYNIYVDCIFKYIFSKDELQVHYENAKRKYLESSGR